MLHRIIACLARPVFSNALAWTAMPPKMVKIYAINAAGEVVLPRLEAENGPRDPDPYDSDNWVETQRDRRQRWLGLPTATTAVARQPETVHVPDSSDESEGAIRTRLQGSLQRLCHGQRFAFVGRHCRQQTRNTRQPAPHEPPASSSSGPTEAAAPSAAPVPPKTRPYLDHLESPIPANEPPVEEAFNDLALADDEEDDTWGDPALLLAPQKTPEAEPEQPHLTRIRNRRKRKRYATNWRKRIADTWTLKEQNDAREAELKILQVELDERMATIAALEESLKSRSKDSYNQVTAKVVSQQFSRLKEANLRDCLRRAKKRAERDGQLDTPHPATDTPIWVPPQPPTPPTPPRRRPPTPPMAVMPRCRAVRRPAAGTDKAGHHRAASRSRSPVTRRHRLPNPPKRTLSADRATEAVPPKGPDLAHTDPP